MIIEDKSGYPLQECPFLSCFTTPIYLHAIISSDIRLSKLGIAQMVSHKRTHLLSITKMFRGN